MGNTTKVRLTLEAELQFEEMPDQQTVIEETRRNGEVVDCDIQEINECKQPPSKQ